MSDAIIWPAYLDADKARREGRRVPVDDAVSAPTAREIAAATREIGYDAQIEPDQRYPRSWWEDTGRVRVRGVEESKRDLLRGVAVYLDAIRADAGDDAGTDEGGDA